MPKGMMAAAAALSLIALMFSTGAEALCVKETEANLRAGPGTGYEKTWVVGKYTPLRKLKRSGDWYKVRDLEGDTHWVFRKLVTDRFKCAVVKEDWANIRSGPGTNYGKLFFSPILKYYSFKVLKTSGQWVKVMDEYGDSGWIFRPLLWIQ